MTGESTASRPGVISSRSEVLVQMSTTAAVVGLLGVVHDPRVVAELVPHLTTTCPRRGRPRGSPARRTGTRPTRRAAARRARPGGRPGSREVEACAAQRLLERAEQRRGGDDGRRDRDALRDGLRRVADGVQAARISRRPPSNSPDISAMPCALSDTGRTCPWTRSTPTVVSMPMPVSAMKYSALGQFAVPPQEEAADDRAADHAGSTTRWTRGRRRTRPGSSWPAR